MQPIDDDDHAAYLTVGGMLGRYVPDSVVDEARLEAFFLQGIEGHLAIMTRRKGVIAADDDAPENRLQQVVTAVGTDAVGAVATDDLKFLIVVRRLVVVDEQCGRQTAHVKIAQRVGTASYHPHFQRPRL